MSGRKLSVALPVRNGADYLGAALTSILDQSHSDFDLFVSDNASNDETPAILADFAKRDHRVKVSRSEVMLSQVANMNRAVALADTPWVKLFCHDDLMRQDCVAKILAVLDKVAGSPVALIGNGERYLFANGYISDAEPDYPVVIVLGREAIRRGFSRAADTLPLPAVTTATVRKDAFEARGGFDERFVHFDTFCWYEMLIDWDYAWVPAQLTVNRIHGGQVAVDARKSGRTIADFRSFLPDFVSRHGAALGLGVGARLRAAMMPIGFAANTLVSEAKAGRWNRVASVIRQLPAHWLVPLAPLTLRAWARENRRIAGFLDKVPLDLIYP